MSDILTASNVYQGTFTAGTVTVDPVFQICAVSNLSASNLLDATFWCNRNGERITNNLGNASYRIRDKDGALVPGMSSVSVTPDINGYYRITPVTAVLIYDLTHYVMEIEIPVDGNEIASSLGLIIGGSDY